MGSWWSSSSAATTRVAVLGLSESGKSHFIHFLRNEDPPTRPTNGRDQQFYAHEGEQIDFTEFGFLASQLVPGGAANAARGQEYDCVMWIIDAHDCEEEIYNARNMIMHFAEGRRPPALCIVQNIGRPFGARHNLCRDECAGTWHWSQTENTLLKASANTKPVSWELLQTLVRVPGLMQVYSRVAFAQLSYTDPASTAFMFDWIVRGH